MIHYIYIYIYITIRNSDSQSHSNESNAKASRPASALVRTLWLKPAESTQPLQQAPTAHLHQEYEASIELIPTTLTRRDAHMQVVAPSVQLAASARTVEIAQPTDSAAHSQHREFPTRWECRMQTARVPPVGQSGVGVHWCISPTSVMTANASQAHASRCMPD